MRYLGVDPGKKRVGVALSDPTRTIATPLATLSGRDQGALVAELGDLARRHEVSLIVVGHPLNMDGSAGPAAKAAQRLARALAESTGLPVELSDERLTSSVANQALRQGGLDSRRARQKVDEVAAVLILQNYLDKGSCSGETERQPS